MPAPTGVVKIGKGVKVYVSVSTVGALSARTWLLYGEIQEAKQEESWEEAKIEEYGADFATYLRGIGDAPATLKISRRPGKTAYDALESAKNSGADIGLAFVTHGATIAESGARGVYQDVKIFGWKPDTSRTGSAVDVDLKLSAEASTVRTEFTVA